MLLTSAMFEKGGLSELINLDYSSSTCQRNIYINFLKRIFFKILIDDTATCHIIIEEKF